MKSFEGLSLPGQCPFVGKEEQKRRKTGEAGDVVAEVGLVKLISDLLANSFNLRRLVMITRPFPTPR